jgi:uncharacterized protein with HEPN domain
VIDRKVAKELLHVREWLDRAQEIVDRGKETYLRDDLLQEAGDSLMMKLGEASNRLSRAGIEGPDGVSWQDAIANRNWLIHQYDEIDREITWTTLARDLPRWRQALARAFESAEDVLADDASGD